MGIAKMKIIITGAAGYVGSYLASRLIRAGHNCTLIDNFYIPSNLTHVCDVPIQHLDIRTPAHLQEFDVMFHLAAISGIKQCEDNVADAHDVNTRGTFNLLKTFKGKIIFASTSAVYGEASQPIIDELHPAAPVMFYGSSKLYAENIVRLHDKYCILRFSNIYGYGMNCKKTVIDLFLENAINKKIVDIHGDGKQRRDFVHIQDVVRAYICAMNNDLSGTFNVGGNEALSVNEIFELISKSVKRTIGHSPEKKYVGSDCGRIWKDFTYSSELAKEMLKYEPLYSVKDEIIERVNIYQKRVAKC
jgi:UDP-glucose 4-epimerase